MNLKELNGAKNTDLIRSCEAARILGVSREYIRQLIMSKKLQPRYIFNVRSARKIYVFDKKTIANFGDPEFSKANRSNEPEKSGLMTTSILAKILKCSSERINTAVKRGFLVPELILSGSRKPLCLFNKDAAAAAIREYNASGRNVRSGHSVKTLKLMEKIKQLHKQGLNDLGIAKKLKSTQPFIFKLRKELGLMSNARIKTAKRRAALEKKLGRKHAVKKRKAAITAARNLKQKPAMSAPVKKKSIAKKKVAKKKTRTRARR